MSQRALDLIRAAKSTRAQKLDLGNCGLTELPDALFELVDLEVLCLCTQGWFFDVKTNKDIPFKSKNKGEKNNIKQLSPKISQLKNLKVLLVTNSFSDKSNLNDLNPLKGLVNLQQLYVSNTQVSDLSPLKDLVNLQRLGISNTQVSDLSPLKKIIEKGRQVKWSIFGGHINVEDCPLSNPPQNIAKQGNKAILNYWQQIEAQGVETINEGKLIIVGEGDTGKTTLFNKLIYPDFDVAKNPSSETQGINIHEGLLVKDGFRANLWDFGGQELQYMTHQFFLSPKAVYVLMMASRAEAPNLAYWFKIISLLGKDRSDEKVSLVIVLNKKKGSTGTPQYQDLLALYKDEFDYQFIEVDLALNDKRWESLKEAIEERLLNLPIVKNALPKQWKPIREALRAEAAKKPYINAERLGELCEPFRVTLPDEQFLMTEYLHQLGSVLHFQNVDDNLLDLIVLSPEWAVEGVYTVLKNEHIKDTLKGKFTATDMSNVLCKSHYKSGDASKAYSKVDAQKLLLLMSKNNFDICYKSENGNYVAAQLLPDDRPPQYKWFTNAALQFRYQYPIMPKGLMSRLIVRLSEYLEVLNGVEIVWKKGAILRIPINGSICRVMMREEDGETKTGLKQIVIEVLGDAESFRNRKYALQRVRQEIESLHKRWFKNIQSEQIVPCNCFECQNSETPFTYELTRLQNLTKGRAYCEKLEEFVPLRQLLEGVYDDNEIQSFERQNGDTRTKQK